MFTHDVRPPCGADGAVRQTSEGVVTPHFTTTELATLFGTTRSVIERHLALACAAGEIASPAASCPGTPPSHVPTMLYGLDALCALGWRVGSARGALFRRWASSVLERYLVRGYATLDERLAQRGLVMRVMPRAARRPHEGVRATVVHAFAPAFEVLDAFDRDALPWPAGNVCAYRLSVADARRIVAELRTVAPSELFGVERAGMLEGAIGAVYQTFGGEDLYPSAEEQAARLFYNLIKDHPFVDGNKRIACALFLHVLDRNFLLFDGATCRISAAALAALALLVAASRPDEKEVMVALVMNVLALGWA